MPPYGALVEPGINIISDLGKIGKYTAETNTVAKNAAKVGNVAETAHVAEVAASTRPVTQVLHPAASTAQIAASNASGIGRGIAAVSVGGGATYGIVKGVNRADQMVASLPHAIEHVGENFGRTLENIESGLVREMHALEAGAAQALGAPVSSILQVVVAVGVVVGVVYVTYKIVD